MKRIIVLDEVTANKIAAGEVIERPASIVKELLENSIDAGSTRVTIDIRGGGIKSIRISDDGVGIHQDDLEVAFERHATSKITCAEDLFGITTMGFRGEALASIGAVSNTLLVSKTSDSRIASYINISGGRILDKGQCAGENGTTITIKDLFFNTPARYKFLKKDSTEAAAVVDIVTRMALAHPEIAFRLTGAFANKNESLHTNGNGDLKSVIYNIYGSQTARNLLEVNYHAENVEVSGYIGNSEISRGNRGNQTLLLNSRFIKSRIVNAAVEEAYKSYIMKNKYPFYVLKVKLNPSKFDVNVHPNKLDVRFTNEKELFTGVHQAVLAALNAQRRDRSGLLGNVKLEEVRTPIKEVRNPIKEVRNPIKNVETQKNEQVNLADIRRVYNIKTEAPQIIRIEPKDATTEVDSKSHIEPKKQIEPESQNEPENQIVPESQNEPENHIETRVQDGTEMDTTSQLEPVPEEKVESIKEEVYKIELDDRFIEFSDTIKEVKYIGQLFNTYCMFQAEEQVYLLDQHAGHERVNYERLRERYAKKKIETQPILVPEILNLGPEDVAIIVENKEVIEGLGFECEVLGSREVMLKGMPETVAYAKVSDCFNGIIEKLKKGASDFEKLTDECIYDIACKASIKANMGMNYDEVLALIEQLRDTQNPWCCPHGRPTIVKLTKTELEKLFKRIV